MDLAPGSRGLSQLSPSRRALCASRCSAGCCQAEPARRAVLGLELRCAGGPPPRRARRFSTADRGQSRAGAASPGGYRHPAGQRRALVDRTREGGETATRSLKERRRGREPDPAPRALSGSNQGRRRLAPRVGPAWEEPREGRCSSPHLLLSYILDLSCELEAGIRSVRVPSSLQFHFLPPTAPSLVSINQQMGLLELGDITQSHFHVVFISVKIPSAVSCSQPEVPGAVLVLTWLPTQTSNMTFNFIFSSGMGGWVGLFWLQARRNSTSLENPQLVGTEVPLPLVFS